MLLGEFQKTLQPLLDRAATDLIAGISPVDRTEEAEKAEEAKDSLEVYIEQAWPIVEPGKRYSYNWHIGAMCYYLEAVTAGEIQNLLINIPPGFAKSLVVSVLWPTWEWGPKELPYLRYVAAANNLPLAIRDSKRSRDVILSEWYQTYYGHVFRLEDDQNQKLRYQNDHKGYRVAKGVGSGTGERGDRVIFDDPHELDDAYFPTKLEAAVQYNNTTLDSRLADREVSAKVVVQQRVAVEDVTGDILAKMDQGGRQYEVLILPMRHDPAYQLVLSAKNKLPLQEKRTVEGELLDPKRYSEESVGQDEINYEDRAPAILQQRPSSKATAVFDPTWFAGPSKVLGLYDDFPRIQDAIKGRNRYDPADPYLKNFVKYRWLSYDTAFKDKDVNDRTAKVVIEMLPDYTALVRYAEAKLATVPEVEDEIVRDSRLWNYDGKLRGIIIEDKGSGIGILQTLARSNPTIAELLIPFDPRQDSKEYRARQTTVWIRQDCFWLPIPSMSAEWLGDFEDALFGFPRRGNKDLVDAFTQFILYSEPRIQRGWIYRQNVGQREAS